MRTLLRPRLASLDVFASALLVTLGVGSQTGCGSDVSQTNESAGGSGGAGTGAGNGSTSGPVGPGGSSVTGMTTSTGNSTASVGVGGGAGGCTDPKPVLVKGMDTGIDVCAGGQFRRRAAIECPTNYPDTNPCCGGCPEGQICNTAGEVACSCVAACTNDSQCAADQLCLCGDPAGVCVSAQCHTGAECAAGEECTSWDQTLGCLYYSFACTTEADTCGGDLDCKSAPNQFCAVQSDGHRECVAGGCAIGRPFLVDDEARTAVLTRRVDWCKSGLAPSLTGLDEAFRAELAEAWEHTARMEHASIAAFARFSLQLLALGAPPDLIERTNRALADETKHARAAFALASAYRGAGIGPGALPIDGALAGNSDVAAVIRLVVREGCVGETVAAVEAGEAEAGCLDPVVRGVLGEIANDESEHAELAWHTVRWALATFGDEVRLAVRGEIALLKAELEGASAPGPSERDAQLLSRGVVTSPMRARIRRSVLGRAVVPCLEALLEDARPMAA